MNRLTEIAEEIDAIIKNNCGVGVDKYGDNIHKCYSDQTIAIFKKTSEELKTLAKTVWEIDKLISGDQSEQYFLKEFVDEKHL